MSFSHFFCEVMLFITNPSCHHYANPYLTKATYYKICLSGLANISDLWKTVGEQKEKIKNKAF